MRAETRAAVSYGFLEFFFCSTPTHHEKAARHSTRARRHAQPFSNYGGEADARGDARRARDAAACASLPLKCPSPVTLEAMHIARRCGVLTDLEVASAGDGRNPSRRVSGALVGSVLRYDEEKENIDPVTGVHARLASGVAAGTNARGASRLSSNRAIATLPRALVFKIRTDARPTSSERTQAPRILDRSPTPRLGRPIRARASPWRTSRPRSSTWCVARAFPARRGRAKTNTADARFEQRHFFPLGFENAIRARVTSSGLPFPPIPPAPSSTDRDPFPPRAGTPQARQIGATRGRAGTPKRTPRRTRARASRISPRAAFSKNARHFLRSSLVSAFETRVTPGR